MPELLVAPVGLPETSPSAQLDQQPYSLPCAAARMSRSSKPSESNIPLGPALAMIDAELGESGLRRYSLSPPRWRAPWLGPDQPETGFPQFYPAVKGQDEDILTEVHVKNGFVCKTVVQVSPRAGGGKPELGLTNIPHFVGRPRRSQRIR